MNVNDMSHLRNLSADALLRPDALSNALGNIASQSKSLQKMAKEIGVPVPPTPTSCKELIEKNKDNPGLVPLLRTKFRGQQFYKETSEIKDLKENIKNLNSQMRGITKRAEAHDKQAHWVK